MVAENEGIANLVDPDTFTTLAEIGTKFYALNLSEPSIAIVAPPSINIIVQSLPIELPLSTYVALNVEQLEAAFDLTAEITQQTVMLGDTEAVQLQYSAYLFDPTGQQMHLTNTQYLMVQGKDSYVVTLAVPQITPADILAQYIDSAETFRLTGE